MVKEVRIVVLVDAERGLRVQGNCPAQQTIAYLEMAKHLLLSQEVGKPKRIAAGEKAQITQAPIAKRVA